MKKERDENLETYPEDYRIIFDNIKISVEQELNKNESEEINELRQAVININAPEYTYTTSASGYSPTFRIN